MIVKGFYQVNSNRQQNRAGASKGARRPNRDVNESGKIEKVKISVGILFLILAILLLISFVSYSFNGARDQSNLDIPLTEQVKGLDTAPDNEGGHIGNYFSDMFINRGFGLGAFFIIAVLFFIGTKLAVGKPKKILGRIIFLVLAMFWLSVFLGLFVPDNNSDLLFLSGRYGYGMSRILISMCGNVVSFLLVLFALFVILIFAFKNVLPYISRVLKSSSRVVTDKVAEKRVQKDRVAGQSGYVAPVHKETEGLNNNADNIVASDVAQTSTVSIDNNKVNTEKPDGSLSDIPIDIQSPTAATESETTEDEQPEASGVDFEVAASVSEEQVRKIPSDDYDPRLDLSNFKFPSLDFLVEHQSGEAKVTEEELLANKNKIVETLRHYKIEIVEIKATIGPTITLYEIVPAPGVRISKIKGLEDDIALSLAALGIRIIAPIPGRGTIGIEVPNQNPEVVSMRSIIASKKYQTMKAELPLALGKTISNETFCADLAKMPHALVAGATGQGKSVGMNAIITSLLYKKHPAELKFVMIDPKKVELSLYSKIEKHYLAKLPNEEEPIITDVQKVKNTLNSLNIEMDTRYDLLKKAGSRNIKEYNAKFISRRLNPENGHRYLPYIVVLIDEFADLIMTAGKEIELPIARIAQLARAVGIHMIVATQRPSANIITGIIKANFPTRIAFKVASMIDSRTILDAPGANQLIGKGDMLVSQGNQMVRVQCAFVDTPEVEQIVDFIEEQQSYPSAFMLPEYTSDEDGGASLSDLGERDSLFEDVARIVVSGQMGSTSMIQRKFSIGYNRAGRIMDQLEAAGIVGPAEGSKPRQVLISDEITLEQILSE